MLLLQEVTPVFLTQLAVRNQHHILRRSQILDGFSMKRYNQPIIEIGSARFCDVTAFFLWKKRAARLAVVFLAKGA